MANAMDLTAAPTTRPRARAVNYAEDLGLNSTHENAKAAAEALGVLYHQRAQHEKSIREIKGLIAHHENRVVEKVRADNPDLGPTAFERLVKQAQASDDILVALGQDLRDRQADAGEAEAEIRANEVSLKVDTARMNQLGGYFSYLAASKEALTAERLIAAQIP